MATPVTNPLIARHMLRDTPAPRAGQTRCRGATARLREQDLAHPGWPSGKSHPGPRPDPRRIPLGGHLQRARQIRWRALCRLRALQYAIHDRRQYPRPCSRRRWLPVGGDRWRRTPALPERPIPDLRSPGGTDQRVRQLRSGQIAAATCGREPIADCSGVTARSSNASTRSFIFPTSPSSRWARPATVESSPAGRPDCSASRMAKLRPYDKGHDLDGVYHIERSQRRIPLARHQPRARNHRRSPGIPAGPTATKMIGGTGRGPRRKYVGRHGRRRTVSA